MDLVRGAGYGDCNSGVIYMIFQNGRNALMFGKGDIVISVAGAADRQPRLEYYYMSIDTFRLIIPHRPQAVDHNMEGECHIRVTRDNGDFLGIACDVYDRAKGLSFSARMDNIADSEHRSF